MLTQTVPVSARKLLRQGHPDEDEEGGPTRSRGGFVAGDFTSTSNSIENIATPKVGLSKTVTVPNAANAAIVLVGQPRISIVDPAPGASPVGLGVISLLLLGGGCG